MDMFAAQSSDQHNSRDRGEMHMADGSERLEGIGRGDMGRPIRRASPQKQARAGEVPC